VVDSSLLCGALAIASGCEANQMQDVGDVHSTLSRLESLQQQQQEQLLVLQQQQEGQQLSLSQQQQQQEGKGVQEESCAGTSGTQQAVGSSGDRQDGLSKRNLHKKQARKNQKAKRKAEKGRQQAGSC
jgi:hypothetical protein